MKPSAILHEALALLRDGKGWTKNAAARDKYGRETLVLSDVACKYCLVGAVMRVAKQNRIVNLQPVFYYLLNAANSKYRLTDINDAAESFDTVATILRNAAACAEHDGQ